MATKRRAERPTWRGRSRATADSSPRRRESLTVASFVEVTGILGRSVPIGSHTACAGACAMVGPAAPSDERSAIWLRSRRHPAPSTPAGGKGNNGGTLPHSYGCVLPDVPAYAPSSDRAPCEFFRCSLKIPRDNAISTSPGDPGIQRHALERPRCMAYGAATRDLATVRRSVSWRRGGAPEVGVGSLSEYHARAHTFGRGAKLLSCAAQHVVAVERANAGRALQRTTTTRVQRRSFTAKVGVE